jgi:type II secretory pathway pseudopilin PulG
MKKSLFRRKLRGISLLETLLSLAVGGVVIVSSVQGLTRYTESVKVQATASLITRLNVAADLYAQDNYDNLVAAAPQELAIGVLQPYFGSNIRQDAFKNSYVMSTRTYIYQTPDPVNGGLMNQNALQVLIVGRNPDQTRLDEKISLRSEIANSAGADAGFISLIDGMCQDNTGTGLPVGSICGSFGSCAIQASQFPATNFANAAVVSMVTKGDSSVYGDQLYRYNYGDPELNTMHTTLNMDDNEIINAATIRGNQIIEQEGPTSRITNREGTIQLEARNDVRIDADTNHIIITDNAAGSKPTIRSSTGALQFGRGGQGISVGDETSNTIRQIGSGAPLGTGYILSDRLFGNEARIGAINSLHKRREDPLRLQQFARGEVVIGNRARYTPARGRGSSSSRYELSDGQLTAGVIKAQDITCADCGGNLSDILPRWRHMGTYFVNESTGGVNVPKPNCSLSRRDEINRGTMGDESPVSNSSRDPRYAPRILILPKHIVQGNNSFGRAGFDIEFFARDISGNRWRVYANTPGDQARVEALAMTYCVFLGGPPAKLYPHNPSNSVYPTRSNTPGGGSWTVME